MSTAAKHVEGRLITAIEIRDGETLLISFDGIGLKVTDVGQQCCESRSMSSDDDLAHFVGARFLGTEMRDAPDVEEDGDTHEVRFLIVNTSLGSFTVANHNHHNGYYGGFDIAVELVEEDLVAKAAKEDDDRIKELARLYAGMTPKQIADHEDWVRRFKDEKAIERAADAEKRRNRIVAFRTMTDEAAAASVLSTVGEDDTGSEALSLLHEAGFVRLCKEEVAITVNFRFRGSCRFKGLPASVAELERNLRNVATIENWGPVWPDPNAVVSPTGKAA